MTTTMTEPKTTPALKQYGELKKKHPDYLIVFKAGDFCNLYHKDAKEAARILGLTLTQRIDEQSGNVPMTGFPAHAMEASLKRLIAAGLKIAIADPHEDEPQFAGIADEQESPPIAVTEGFCGTFFRLPLVDALEAVSAVVPGRPIKPILICVRIVLTDAEATFEATSMEVGIARIDRQVQTERDGAACIPHDMLLRVVKAMTDDMVKLDAKDGNLRISGSRSVQNIRTQGIEHFPQLAAQPGTAHGTVKAADFLRLVRSVRHAVSDEASNAAYKAYSLSAAKGSIRCVTNDTGRRVADGNVPYSGDAFNTLLVSPQCIKAVESAASDPDSDISIWSNDNLVHFAGDDFHIYGVLYEGNPPDWEGRVPTDFDREASTGRESLLSDVRQSQICMTDSDKRLRVTFGPSGIALKSVGQSGDSDVGHPCKYTGAPLEIGFNSKFLADALSAAETDDVTIDLTNEKGMTVLKFSPEFRCFVSPVALT